MVCHRLCTRHAHAVAMLVFYNADPTHLHKTTIIWKLIETSAEYGRAYDFALGARDRYYWSTKNRYCNACVGLKLKLYNCNIYESCLQSCISP